MKTIFQLFTFLCVIVSFVQIASATTYTLYSSATEEKWDFFDRKNNEWLSMDYIGWD